MRRLATFSLLLASCSSESTVPAQGADATSDAAASEVSAEVSADTAVGDAQPPVVHAARYCEILVGFLAGADVRLEVWNTFGLNDCPEDVWSKVDPVAVKADRKSDAIVLNGPRYWAFDRFAATTPLDATPQTLGGLQMRKAGEIVVPLAEVMGGGMPYTLRSVRRDTTWIYAKGSRVYELVDAGGKAYAMQSWSGQKEPLTEADLATLAAKLTLPAGWSYRTRVLEAELPVSSISVDGGVRLATVVQDDLQNTYQLEAP